MPSDYIPDSFENRYNWLVNLKTQVNTNAAALKLDAAKLAAFNTMIDSLIAVYKAVIDAQTALDTASGNAHDTYDSNVGDLRAFINEMKNNTLCTDGMEAAMQILTTGGGPADADIKPSINAAPARGYVRITGSKNYAETVNLYMRRKNGQWVLIAAKRKRFPFDDQTPLAVAGVPEEREYMARGVNGDDEVGQDSDIVSAVFAG
jgi:hypothetical protein